MNEKVLGTIVSLSWDHLNKMKEFGFKGHHNQFRIICKCKSMADGNRKCEAAGIGKNVFKSKWCSPTGNERELDLSTTADIWLCVDGSTTWKTSKWVTPSELNS